MRKNKDYHYCYIKCSTSSYRYIYEFFTLAKVKRGFEINQRIAYTSYDHLAMVMMELKNLKPKQMTVKTYNKTVSKIIDVVNVVDFVY